MAGAPRSLVLIAWQSAAAPDNSPVWLGPANTVTLVKSIYAHNASTIAADVTVIASATGQFSFWLARQNIAANATFNWEGWFVLNPDHALYVSVTQPSVSVWVSGASLLGAPPYPPAEQLLGDLDLRTPLPVEPQTSAARTSGRRRGVV